MSFAHTQQLFLKHQVLCVLQVSQLSLMHYGHWGEFKKLWRHPKVGHSMYWMAAHYFTDVHGPLQDLSHTVSCARSTVGS